MRRRLMLAALALLAFGAPPARAQGQDVVVFAAASLKDALDAIATKWQSETGKRATISYAASPTLAKQIVEGAPADIFISADRDWMKFLADKNQVKPGTETELLGNKLVLIAPADSNANLTIAPNFPLAAALGGGKLAMADPTGVPAGKYGKAALTTLGVWDEVSGAVAAAENVRAALLLVARGEAPFGIVYQTDAAVEKRVKVVGAFPPNSYPPVVYPMALTAGSTNPDAALLAQYLRGAAARALFEKQGFSVLSTSP